MRTPITNLTIATLFGAVLSANTASAQDVAVKADYVFAVNKSLISRCAADYEFNTALANNATTENDELAVRDLIRTFRDCEDKYRLPQHTGFSYLAVEALEFGNCAPSTCSESTKREVAKSTFDISAEFIERYAEVLRVELQESCLRYNDFQCATDAVDAANDIFSGISLDAFELDSDGRVYMTTKEKSSAGKPIPGLVDFAVDLKDTVKTVYPEGISEVGEITNDLSENLAEIGYETSEDGITVEGIPGAVEVWAKNDIVKLVFNGDSGACSWISKNMKDIGAIEFTVDLRLQRNGDTSSCSAPGDKKLSIAFDLEGN